MNLMELKVGQFINDVDSEIPAPARGSVSALVSSLGASLTRLVGHLTINTKEYQHCDIETKENFRTSLIELLEIRDALKLLVTEDAKMNTLRLNAYKLSDELPSEEITRNDAIQHALLKTVEVSMEIALLSWKALSLTSIFSEYGSKEASTDLGVAAIMLYSGLESSALNAKVDLKNLKDRKAAEEKRIEIEKLLKDGQELKDSVLRKIGELL